MSVNHRYGQGLEDYIPIVDVITIEYIRRAFTLLVGQQEGHLGYKIKLCHAQCGSRAASKWVRVSENVSEMAYFVSSGT